jgi:hypothetical protein
MRNLLLTVIALLSLNVCKADITIYRLTDSARQIGSPGQDVRLLLTGFIAFDETSTNGTADAIVVWTYRVGAAKYFQMVPHTFNVSQVPGRNATSWTTFREFHSISTNSVTGESYILAYGQNVTLRTSSTNTVSAPRIMTAKPQEIASGARDLILDSTFTAVFDSKDTLAANGQSLTINDEAAALRQKYLSLGYLESSPYW